MDFPEHQPSFFQTVCLAFPAFFSLKKHKFGQKKEFWRRKKFDFWLFQKSLKFISGGSSGVINDWKRPFWKFQNIFSWVMMRAVAHVKR